MQIAFITDRRGDQGAFPLLEVNATPVLRAEVSIRNRRRAEWQK
jgi:hypothetical protein